MALKVDSAWETRIVKADGFTTFDTPKCAFSKQRAGTASSEISSRGYYTRGWLPASALRFALGSDVSGPMGADLVAVEVEHAEQFARDHQAKAMLKADEVTPTVLHELM